MQVYLALLVSQVQEAAKDSQDQMECQVKRETLDCLEIEDCPVYLDRMAVMVPWVPRDVLAWMVYQVQEETPVLLVQVVALDPPHLQDSCS